MNRVLLSSFLLVPSLAAAQTTSDLMPAQPAASGGARAFYPGMPLPSPSGGERTAIRAGSVGDTGAGGKPAGRAGYDIYGPSGVFGGDDQRTAGRLDSDALPETHVVRKGDTLWEIAGYYFKNPWTWPKLWALNPSITNPHWIYPGDIVRLMNASTAPASVPEATPNRLRRPLKTEGVFLRQVGFVEEDELKNAGSIVGSKEEKIMLGTLDEAYVGMKKEAPLRVGERYTIYRPTNEVKHPVTHKKLGTMVEILGEAEVKTITDGGIARCLILDGINPIERGYKIGPLRRQFKVVEPVKNDKELDGVIVVGLRPLRMLSYDNLVFIDRGKVDGVVPGNRFVVTRRGDGYQSLLGTGPIDNRKYPRETIAEILIVDVRQNLATGFVTKSKVDARIGDRVEARRGY